MTQTVNARTSTAPRVFPPKTPSHLDDFQPFRVWANQPTYLEDPCPWKCVAAFYYLTDAVEYARRCTVEVIVQTGADCAAYHHTDCAPDVKAIAGRLLPVDYERGQTVEAPELLASLVELSEWMREHTGPRDGTHDMLVRAFNVLDRVGACV